MKKVVLLISLACVVTSAMADGDIVLKDTRSYLESADGKQLLLGGQSITIGGEYLVKTGEWCDRKVYSRLADTVASLSDGHVMAIPNIETKNWHYRCDRTGNPV